MNLRNEYNVLTVLHNVGVVTNHLKISMILCPPPLPPFKHDVFTCFPVTYQSNCFIITPPGTRASSDLYT